jgi:hypothetical protein
MFKRDYKKLAERLNDSENPLNILINETINDEETKNLQIINCQHGWSFDTTIFPSTVISEV